MAHRFPQVTRWLFVSCSLALASTAAAQAGTVESEQKISATDGGFEGILQVSDSFGTTVASLELNAGGRRELAVGAYQDDDGGSNQGAVWILFLNADGTVDSEQKISELAGLFSGDLDPNDDFGAGLCSPGDLNADGIDDLIVGARGDDDGGGSGRGAIWVLYLNSNGTVSSSLKISETSGGLGGGLTDGGSFGSSICSLGDLDGPGGSALTLAVGAYQDEDSGVNQGAVWILFLNADETVASKQRISNTFGGFAGGLDDHDSFGQGVCSLGDLDGDGIGDLAAGAYGDDDGGAVDSDRGAVWILFLNQNGTVKSRQKISALLGEFEGDLNPSDAFGQAVSALGDLDGDGIGDLAVSAEGDDVVGPNQGAIWILFLKQNGTVAFEQKISATAGGFGGPLEDDDRFGNAITRLGDLDGDGTGEIAIGAYSDDDGGAGQGAVWILSLESHPAPSVLYHQKISSSFGGFTGTLDTNDNWGQALQRLGDLDGDGVEELAVGALGDDDGGTSKGAVWILFMNSDGTVGSQQKISDTVGGLGSGLDDFDNFGVALARLGDLDGDTVPDLAVGAYEDDDGGTGRGAVWILFLDTDGTVKGKQKISDLAGGFAGTLSDGDAFGGALESLGDLDGDGVTDLAVGAAESDDGGTDRGAVWILFLDTDGTVKSAQEISEGSGGFSGTLGDGDWFGYSVAALGDLDGAGPSALALAVGARNDDTGGMDSGAAWILFLSSAGAVLAHNKIAEGTGGFAASLDVEHYFGASVESLGDAGGPGVLDLAVGAVWDDEGDTNTGALWILSLDAAGEVLTAPKINASMGGFTGTLDAEDWFGGALANLGDLDGDGRTDLAVGAQRDEGLVADSGALWVLFLNDGTLALGANATTWDGSTDTDWTDATNWSNAVPDSTKTAIIPDAVTTPNDPVIAVSGQQCNTLWIQDGGTLDISAGMDSLGVFGGATVFGPITGTGELVFEAPGPLGGNSTIGLSFAPFAVRADADLELQGGLLTITGALLGNTDVLVANGAAIDVGGAVQVTSDLAIDGSLTVGDGLDVGDTLSSSSSGELEVMGTGTCVTAGQLCFHGDVTTSCSLSVENSTAGSTEFEATNGWPADVTIDVAGTVDMLTADLVIGGDFLVQDGTLVLGVDSKITTGGASGIRIADADALDPIARFDLGAHLLQVPAPEGITVGNRGKLDVGEGGEIELAGTLTVESGGALCLDGIPSDPASIASYLGNRYTLALNSGSMMAARGFRFSGMTSSGIVIGPGVTLAAAPLDLRAGVFDDPAPGGVLLDIERPLATQLRYLRFDNSFAAAGVANVRTTLGNSVLTLVNWSGDLAPDATTAETFDLDPGESSPPERIVFAPPEESDVQDFTASWMPGFVRTSWSTNAEVDSQAFVVRRSPEPPGTFVDVGEMPSAGASSYELHDYAFTAFDASRYRLYERLTHGELRLIDEVMLPASGIVPRTGGSTPAPPLLDPQPLVVGPGGRYPDVRTALVELARNHQSTPLTLELARGTHEAFELGRGLSFDLCLVARPGAVIDASRAPLRVEELASNRSLELVDIVVDARRGQHPAVEVTNSQGMVLFQDVRLRSSSSAAAMLLSNSSAVAIQGGELEDELELANRSHATMSAVALTSVELGGRSALETRGMDLDPALEPGSRWLACGPAPRLTLEHGQVTVSADAASLAWLLSARGLGFHGVAGIEGVNLLDPWSTRLVGRARFLANGEALWALGALPSGEALYLQALTLDGASRRVALTDVLRVESGR